jgi:hypothetical protein
MKAGRATCAWRISRASAATRSTASRDFIPTLLKETVLRDFAELWPDKFLQRHERRDAAALRSP